MIRNLGILIDDLKPFEGKRKFVLQRHARGESIHYDLRMLVEDQTHLVGLTLNLGNPEKEKQFLKDPTGVQILSEVKLRQPISWLEVQGVVDPGEIGATKNLPAEFKKMDKGYYELGTVKGSEGFFEFFFEGTKGIMQGRWITRKLSLPQDKDDPKSKKVDKLLFWKPKDQEPYSEETK